MQHSTLSRPVGTFRPDPALYPFRSHVLEGIEGQMHYIDEGTGDPILFLHGTPTWSFLYREQIRRLSRTYRCLAPDHIGFGLSDKPAHAHYTLQQHAQNIDALIDRLGLDGITLVVHDFGGPIGLACALRRPEKIRRLVLFNTWLRETAHDPAAQRVDRLLRSAFGKFLYLWLNISPRLLLKKAFGNPAALTTAIHRHYTGVFPHRNDRYGLLGIGRQLVGASAWYGELRRQVPVLADIPALLLWGTKDSYIGMDLLRDWQTLLPQARTIPFECGHFVQEEYPAEAAEAIEHFMATS